MRRKLSQSMIDRIMLSFNTEPHVDDQYVYRRMVLRYFPELAEFYVHCGDAPFKKFVAYVIDTEYVNWADKQLYIKMATGMCEKSTELLKMSFVFWSVDTL